MTIPAAPTQTVSSRRVQRKHRDRWAMKRRWIAAAFLVLTGGCAVTNHIAPGPHDTRQSFHDQSAMRIEYPSVRQEPTAAESAAVASASPFALEDPSELPTIDMSLSDAVQMAIQNSAVIRNAGGTIVQQPQATATVYEPGLVHANPLSGVEAALAAFDAQWTNSLTWNRNDSPQNVAGGGIVAQFTPLALDQTTGQFSSELTKRTVQGATFTLRHIVNYDRNNRPGRAFPSDFTGWVDAEWRQPLLRGAGVRYNQIVGASNFGAPVGQYNGVLIARINEDVALADLENNVITLAADVEAAYRELQTAYRILDATLEGRRSALQTFQYQEVRLKVGAGRKDEEAQARSQFYQFQAQVENQLAGPNGLYALEQRLRYLIGMPASDGS
ncbi:MAG: TolC family protein, partial [Planctomycetota bacterium]